MNKIYLACPYSHPDPAVRAHRAQAVSREAARLMRAGNVVYSPISMGHAIAKADPGLPYDFDWWEKQCLPYLDWADELTVLRLAGWDHSCGVAREIEEARRRGLPISYLAPGAV